MDYILVALNKYVVDPALGAPPSIVPSGQDPLTWIDPRYSILRQFLIVWAFLYASTLILYFSMCSLTYWYYFTPRENNKAMWKYDGTQIRAEMWTSVWSGCIMAGMTAPIEVAVIYGYSKVYSNIDDHPLGIAYLPISMVMFFVFTDSTIYWIHRGLHHRKLYWIHKLHHRYKHTTPWSAFSFHPLDGWSQGSPYHMFVFLFPMHKLLYFGVLFMVGLWTMNIHDRFTFDWFGVNGAAHHTIHHTKFHYNYGQYTVFWDRVFGTCMDPWTVTPYKEVRAGIPVRMMNDQDWRDPSINESTGQTTDGSAATAPVAVTNGHAKSN
jgi:lathosterol oxidase